ncbi:MAG: hypothetical protein WBY44_27675 [Bryobacteraceae bacterium]|jgi:hypothetical protein
MKPVYIALALFSACALWSANSAPDRTQEIVERSVANTNADWAAAPQFDFTERDVITRHGTRTAKSYQVMMIDGSTYNKLIALNGQPLSPKQAAEEERKLADETNRRRGESAAARQKRVAQYQRERRQDHALMGEMVKGFDFKLAGEDTVDGRRCFVLDATPKTGYNPPTRETRVLTSMRGTMWIDMQAYQWVKVHAEVFRPVAFGLFIATVKPGTQFTLEQKPMRGNLWLPSHFSMAVNARVLLSSRHSTDDETYSDYHQASGSASN